MSTTISTPLFSRVRMIHAGLDYPAGIMGMITNLSERFVTVTFDATPVSSCSMDHEYFQANFELLDQVFSPAQRAVLAQVREHGSIATETAAALAVELGEGAAAGLMALKTLSFMYVLVRDYANGSYVPGNAHICFTLPEWQGRETPYEQALRVMEATAA